MDLHLTVSSRNFPFCPRSPSRSRIGSSLPSRRRSSIVFPHQRSARPGGVRCSSSYQQDQAVEGEDGEDRKRSKVSAVLFDMDGVLCNSEELSRMAAVELFAEMGVSVTAEDFIPFTGTGEANFLEGVAKAKGVGGFDTKAAKERFFEIYLDKYAKPDSGIGFRGALELVTQCKNKGLKVAVASSADRIKVEANLAAAGIPSSLFDAIVSADAFENLKPAPDIFLAASVSLNVQPGECVVIEDAIAGVQAAQTAKMRCIAVTTTMSQEALQQAGPSLIKKEIGDISIHDIQDFAETMISFGENSSDLKMATDSSDGPDFSFTGFQVSRRDIVRYGSLGVAFSCLFFTLTNWKTMKYASTKGVLNALFGPKNSIISQNEGKSQSARIQKIVSYISDLESRRDTPSVPEFPAKLDWLNTTPLQFKRDLKGKVVLLDFWTYCCINCMHVLPDLEFLEKKYCKEPFTVVGVHSAKFDNEKDLEAIRSAVLRYNIIHPVVNDGEMYLWRDLGISSWPTFVLVGPNGKLLAEISGEGHREDLDELVGAALQFYDEKKMLSNKSIPLALEKDKDSRLLTSPLKFPGKLAVDVLNNRLFISDSNHNRIVVTDLDGNFILQIGSTGEQGLQDGPFESATFNRPQGVAYNPKKNILYVADTENHALREVDFVNDSVRTLSGNGIRGSDYVGGGKGTTQVLNSPWDVCFEPNNEVVYIAMAGQHQIWEHSTSDGVTRVFSGNGYERNLNGTSSTNTSFAQPSGLSLSPDNTEIYVADSESSSIRAVNLVTGGSRLLAGGDPLFSDNLFKFGDHDGVGSDALFQHPLGIFSASNGQIYIADSYNHKIKKLDPHSRQVVTLAGTGTAGFKDASALSSQLSEPSGITGVGNGKILITDTNNNAIRYLDLNEKNGELKTLELKGVPLPSPKPRSMRRLRRKASSDTRVIKSGSSFSMDGDIHLKISVPVGYHFSKEASSKFDVETEPQDAITIEPSSGNLNSEGSASVHFRRASSSLATARINCKVYYCKEDEVCLYEVIAFDLAFQQESQVLSPSDISISYAVKPKSPSSPKILDSR